MAPAGSLKRPRTGTTVSVSADSSLSKSDSQQISFWFCFPTPTKKNQHPGTSKLIKEANESTEQKHLVLAHPQNPKASCNSARRKAISRRVWRALLLHRPLAAAPSQAERSNGSRNRTWHLSQTAIVPGCIMLILEKERANPPKHFIIFHCIDITSLFSASSNYK